MLSLLLMARCQGDSTYRRLLCTADIVAHRRIPLERSSRDRIDTLSVSRLILSCLPYTSALCIPTAIHLTTIFQERGGKFTANAGHIFLDQKLRITTVERADGFLFADI